VWLEYLLFKDELSAHFSALLACHCI